MIEVAQLADVQDAYAQVVGNMFVAFMLHLGSILAVEANFHDALAQGSEDDRFFLNKLALFFTTLFRVRRTQSWDIWPQRNRYQLRFYTVLQTHLHLLEASETSHALQQGLLYLVKLSELDDEEMFKVSHTVF